MLCHWVRSVAVLACSEWTAGPRTLAAAAPQHSTVSASQHTESKATPV